MASSSTQPLVLQRIQRPTVPGQPPSKPAAVSTVLPSITQLKAAPIRSTQTVTLPPIRQINLPPTPSASRPSLPPISQSPMARPTLPPLSQPPVSRPTLPPITHTPISRPPSSPQPTPAPQLVPAPQPTPVRPEPTPPAALPSAQPKQSRVSRTRATSVPAAAEPSEMPPTPPPTPPPTRQPKQSRQSRQSSRSRTRRVTGSAGPPEPAELRQIPEGFPTITPPRSRPVLPSPDFEMPPVGQYPRIITRSPESPHLRSLPPGQGPGPEQLQANADGYYQWADGLSSGDSSDEGAFYISPEGTEPPYIPQQEQAILDEHQDEPWSQVGSISWTENQLMIGDPEELFHFFRQFNSWDDFIHGLRPAPHQQLGQSILLFNSLDRAGFFNVYTTRDVGDEIDTEIHLV